MLLQCPERRGTEHHEPAAHRVAAAAFQFLIDKIVPGVLVEFIARPVAKEFGEPAQFCEVVFTERSAFATALDVIGDSIGKARNRRFCRLDRGRPIEEFLLYFRNSTTEPAFGFRLLSLTKARTLSISRKLCRPTRMLTLACQWPSRRKSGAFF